MDRTPLAQMLAAAIERSGLALEEISERTKVPRSTIQALLGQPVSAILPPRTYLRGHAALLGRELGLATDEVLATFDRDRPEVEPPTPELAAARLSAGTLALGAAIAGVGVLAIVLAFTH